MLKKWNTTSIETTKNRIKEDEIVTETWNEETLKNLNKYDEEP
jgi:hypothetical protein